MGKGSQDFILNKIETLMTKLTLGNHEEEEWHTLLSESDLAYKDQVTLSECHIIDYIGKNRLTNAIGIATNMNITKGGVSKITARLVKKGFIEVHRLEGNRKEIFFTLTNEGKKIYELHDKLHVRVCQRITDLFDSYTESELQAISRFFSELTDIV